MPWAMSKTKTENKMNNKINIIKRAVSKIKRPCAVCQEQEKKQKQRAGERTKIKGIMI